MRNQKNATHLLIGPESSPSIKMISEYTNVKIPSHPEYQFIVHYFDGDPESFRYRVSEKSTGMSIPYISGEILHETVKKAIDFMSTKTKEEMKETIASGKAILEIAKKNQNLAE